MTDPTTKSIIQLLGAFAFGMIIGWRVYFTDRYRTGAVDFNDIATVIGIVGGGAILSLFQAGTDLFGAYGIGLALGFFAYHVRLAGMVARSQNFDQDFFIDGRRKKVSDEEFIPDYVRSTTTAMGDVTLPRKSDGSSGGPN